MADARITAITPIDDDASRAAVRVGRRIVARLSWAQIEALALAVDQPWDDDLAARVADAAELTKAMRHAQSTLARRPHSRYELGGKLRKRGHGADVCRQVLDTLEQRGELDDEAFAHALVREELARKPAGAMLLRQKLAQKGVPRAIADRVVSEALAERDQVEPATQLARRRAMSLARLDAVTRRRRLHGLLARRGFDRDTIDAALRAVEGDEDS